MRPAEARAAVRACLRSVRPDVDVDLLDDDAALLERRIITSFQVLDLLLHLEHVAQGSIARDKLVPGCFRDIATIARHFLQKEGPA